jgi:DnaK suppressor protein
VAKKSVKRPSKKGAAASKAPSRPAAKSSVVRPVKPSKSKTAPIRNKVKTTLRAPAKAAKPPTLKPAPSKAAKAFTTKSSTNTPFTPKPALVKAASKAAPKVSVVKAEPVKSSKSNNKKVENHHSLRPEPVTVPSPVPTDGKPRKNQAGLLSKELEHFRELLLAKRRELVGDMSSMEREALRSAGGTNLSNLPLHMADMGTDNYEQEFTLGLVEKERGLLREINQALAKIQDGTYGLCEGTGKPISKPRLEAQPWAKYSIEHARMMERTGMGIRRV